MRSTGQVYALKTLNKWEMLKRAEVSLTGIIYLTMTRKLLDNFALLITRAVIEFRLLLIHNLFPIIVMAKVFDFESLHNILWQGIFKETQSLPFNYIVILCLPLFRLGNYALTSHVIFGNRPYISTLPSTFLSFHVQEFSSLNLKRYVFSSSRWEQIVFSV